MSYDDQSVRDLVAEANRLELELPRELEELRDPLHNMVTWGLEEAVGTYTAERCQEERQRAFDQAIEIVNEKDPEHVHYEVLGTVVEARRIGDAIGRRPRT